MVIQHKLITICNDQLHRFINLLSVSSSWMLGFPSGLDSKESACNAGHLGLTPGLGTSPGEGHGNPLQYSCLENPHGQRILAGHNPQGRKKSWTRLND